MAGQEDKGKTHDGPSSKLSLCISSLSIVLIGPSVLSSSSDASSRVEVKLRPVRRGRSTNRSGVGRSSLSVIDGEGNRARGGRRVGKKEEGEKNWGGRERRKSKRKRVRDPCLPSSRAFRLAPRDQRDLDPSPKERRGSVHVQAGLAQRSAGLERILMLEFHSFPSILLLSCCLLRGPT